MDLTYQEKERANKVNSFIRNYALAVQMTFTTCRFCGGTGLSGAIKNGAGYLWNGEFCYKCEGVGFTEWTANETLAVCDRCKGSGRIGEDMYSASCDKCEGQGIMDWITAVKLGIKVGIHD